MTTSSAGGNKRAVSQVRSSVTRTVGSPKSHVFVAVTSENSALPPLWLQNDTDLRARYFCDSRYISQGSQIKHQGLYDNNPTTRHTLLSPFKVRWFHMYHLL